MDVTPHGDTHGVTTQLRLLDGGRPRRRLDPRTQRLGRQGVAEARRRLAQARPPEPGRQVRAAG